MISDKCPVCGIELRKVFLKDLIEYYCSKEIVSHYRIYFSNEGQLISQYFSFTVNAKQMDSRVDFKNKETEIYQCFVVNNGAFKVPCYLGPGDLDKIKSYIMMM